MPVVMGAVYFTIYYLIPNYLLEKKFFQFYIWLFGSALFFTLLQRINVMFIVAPRYTPQYLERTTFFSFAMIYRVINIYTIVAIASSIKLIKHWYTTAYLKDQIEKENLKSELVYLRNQIHPHFLFNTLNNLYALTLKNDPSAPQAVLKLSDLLDYMLYECNTPLITLDKEITFIKNYLSLEKLRHGDMLDVKFEEDGDSGSLRIAPLLLLPLIENAFKHGIRQDQGKPWLSIMVNVRPDHFDFLVENSKPDSTGSEPDIRQAGIGLKNLKRRLNLLYPDRHRLEVSERDTFFSAELSIRFNKDDGEDR